MKIGLLIYQSSKNFNEYLNFTKLFQEKLNQIYNKDDEYKIIEINNQAIENVKEIDIIIFTGGGDIHPEYYNSSIKYSENLYSFDKKRDEIELEILNKYHQNKAVFGICRGIQIINVFFKGALFQHLPYDLRGIVIENAHKIYPEIQKDEDRRKLRHLIKGKIINYINFANEADKKNFVMVNSRHHQAISKLGKDLEILAISRDGVVEILEHKYLPILAVQYHPEQEDIITYQKYLINYFVEKITKNI